MDTVLKGVTAVDASQFHANYDTFPEPLLLRTAEGGWLSNPAADDLCLSQTDFDRLAEWDGNSSIWLAGRFFYVHGHRTTDGLFLLLYADAFLSSGALNLSSQLRRRLTQAFNGVSDMKDHLSGDAGDVKEDLANINRALYQIFRIVTQLERCSENELPCHKVRLDLNAWLRRLGDEMRANCVTSKNIKLRVELSETPMTAAADPALLDCMVTHLVSNALKAAPAEDADITISLKKQGLQAILTISGNSADFSPTFLTDPLWNHPARLLVGRGLGLGLPIAQRIAALHGGALMVSPSKDGGSQVVVSLPTDIPKDFLESPAPDVEPTGGFSMVRIILSDALPPSAFHPDFHPES